MGVFGPRGVNRRLSQHQILPLRGINRLEDLQSDQPRVASELTSKQASRLVAQRQGSTTSPLAGPSQVLLRRLVGLTEASRAKRGSSSPLPL